MSHLVCVGQIVNVHGIKGVVCIKPYLNNPMDIGTFGALTDSSGQKIFALQITGSRGDIVLATLPGITDRTAAESLKGTKLYTHADNLPRLPAGEYYHRDLIGLAVVRQGKPFGVVAHVANHGAGDILDIKLTTGETMSFLFSASTFPDVDITRGTLTIVVPENREEPTDES